MIFPKDTHKKEAAISAIENFYQRKLKNLKKGFYTSTETRRAVREFEEKYGKKWYLKINLNV